MAGGWNWTDKTEMRFRKLIAKKYLDLKEKYIKNSND